MSCNDKSLEREVCSTAWPSPRGTTAPDDPLGFPCAGQNERSSYIRAGQEQRLRSLYCSCPYTLIATDTVVDDLGPVRNLRDVNAAAKSLARGSDARMSGNMADPLTLTPAVTDSMQIATGTYVLLAFQALTTTPVSLRVQVNNFASAAGPRTPTLIPPGGHAPSYGHAVERDVQLELEAGCQAVAIFLPFAAPQLTSRFWGPIAAVPQVTVSEANFVMVSTIVITGLPAGAGVAYAQLVGPYSTMWPTIAGAVNNT